ncbi:hypothetical protein OESDEN_13600 [Oesophagostomum dentatum]|uniref:Uncharacterized protein n=1 Tax=Oesophagostomum dentatum TaxID=61180 RepID=A0A0B1SS12_OESDE|nr:hypothetical protein OESDEN_13600 [Oesophagostomum dentatum]
MPVTPKWKFYSSLMFLDDLFNVHRNIHKRRIDEVSGSSQVSDSIASTVETCLNLGKNCWASGVHELGNSSDLFTIFMRSDPGRGQPS